jgi:zinc D-Ala-D-Ala carboxypeptidase
MKWMRALGDRWPFIALTLTTMIVVMWAGLTLQSVFTPSPQAIRPSPLATTPIPIPLPSSGSKTAPSPLVVQPQRLPTTTITLPLQPPRQLSAPSRQPSTPAGRAPQAVARNNPLPQSRYGHLPYAENSSDRLVSVGTYGTGSNQRTEFLDKEAAAAFAKMKADAEAEGVALVAISGFRSVADQEKLFARQIQRQGSEVAAARLSAPPGYSEHHTGFALDIGDGAQPETDIKFEFEDTKAYRWLQTNGRRYGVELSYPLNNIQGVSFEPWHWRFTNSPYAAAIFSVAHTLTSQPATSGSSSQ